VQDPNGNSFTCSNTISAEKDGVAVPGTYDEFDVSLNALTGSMFVFVVVCSFCCCFCCCFLFLLGFTSFSISYMATHQLNWWRKTSYFTLSILSGTKGHLRRINDIPQATWIASSMMLECSQYVFLNYANAVIMQMMSISILKK
jgi:hypothetical protein